MLAAIGLQEPEELFGSIPPQIRLDRPLALAPGLSEFELQSHLQGLSEGNLAAGQGVSFLGGGAYAHYVPAIVDEVLRRPEFYTAYTPYQPELSQGTLQYIFEFQSMIAALTEMDVANASMYDGASSAAEACLLAAAATERRDIWLPRAVSPLVRQTVATYAQAKGLRVREIPLSAGRTDPAQVRSLLDEQAAVLLAAQPNFLGCLEEMAELAAAAHSHGALFVAYVEPTSLALLATPGEYEADMAVGEGQPLGLPLSFGGPYLGFLASRQTYVRRLPGRIVGETIDRQGRRAYVLTLQAREQHIRREKATSNVCTNQSLCALAACVYLSALGPKGLRQVAEHAYSAAHHLQRRLSDSGLGSMPFGSTPFFHEFCFRPAMPMSKLSRALLERDVFAGLDLSPWYQELPQVGLWATTERTELGHIDRLLAAWRDLAEKHL